MRKLSAFSALTVFAVLAPSLAFAAEAVGPGALTVAGEKKTIELERAVGDLLVIDGRVAIEGVVRGDVYAVDSEVVLRPSGVILGSITLTGGALHLSAGAVLPPTVELRGAEFFGPDGERADPKAPVFVGQGATKVVLSAEPVSTSSVALIKAVLPFERPVPAAGVEVPDLRGWAPGLGLRLGKFVEDPPSMDIGGVSRVSLAHDAIRGAFQRSYRGARGRVRVSGVHLAKPEASAMLFGQIVDATRAVPTGLSIGMNHGEGAHRFFESRGRYVMLWQRGAWLFAIESRLDTDRATAFQQKQFSDQIARSLASGFSIDPNLQKGARR